MSRSLQAARKDPLPRIRRRLASGWVSFQGRAVARAHHETWDDMLRLQADGTYPGAFQAIESPVLMLHGDFDPHPGGMILASLEPYVGPIEYVEWNGCGHYPWAERAVRDDFFAVLRAWLARHTGRATRC